MFQITDALTFLHVSCRYIHRNVCPNSVYVTKPGTWKLAGLEFLGKLSEYAEADCCSHLEKKSQVKFDPEQV